MKKVILLVAAAFALAVPASGVAGPERAATGSTSFADSTEPVVKKPAKKPAKKKH